MPILPLRKTLLYSGQSVFFEYVGGERCSCAFSVGAGDADDRCRAHFKKKTYLRGYDFAGFSSCPQIPVRFGDGWVGDNDIGGFEVGDVVAAKYEFNIWTVF